nr:MAG TPA: hypothetical protein [Caudoviricetes sp.]
MVRHTCSITTSRRAGRSRSSLVLTSCRGFGITLRW